MHMYILTDIDNNYKMTSIMIIATSTLFVIYLGILRKRVMSLKIYGSFYEVRHV